MRSPFARKETLTCPQRNSDVPADTLCEVPEEAQLWLPPSFLPPSRKCFYSRPPPPLLQPFRALPSVKFYPLFALILDFAATWILMTRASRMRPALSRFFHFLERLPQHLISHRLRLLWNTYSGLTIAVLAARAVAATVCLLQLPPSWASRLPLLFIFRASRKLRVSQTLFLNYWRLLCQRT